MNQQPLDRALIKRALEYHGKPLQKIWETERWHQELHELGIDKNLDFSVYNERQKHFTFQGRAKRLKLHQFIVRHADSLFSSVPYTASPAISYKQRDHFAIPPLEVFMDSEEVGNMEQPQETIRPGDVVYGMVSKLKHFAGINFKPALVIGNVTSIVRNKKLKGIILTEHLGPAENTKQDIKKSFFANDPICCEVLNVGPDGMQLFCTMLRTSNTRVPESVTYGLIKRDDFPEVYNLGIWRKEEKYEDFLLNSPSFNDPAYTEQLFTEVGLNSEEFYSNMSSLKGRYPSQEYAGELRNSQNSKWAFRSVAQGIEHFKEGRHTEAFQCLNKALSMDPRNVEGLVARGALYANSGSFKKAVDDFEMALKLNPSHANARKYMGETLVALGRSYEEENRFEEAKKAYQDCLNIIPHHEEAQNSLDFLKSKPFTGKQIVEPTELELPSLNIVKPSSSDRNKQEPDTSGVGGSGAFGGSSSKRDNTESSRKERKKESKKDRKKRHKKHHSSSSDSSSDSSDSSDSSSDSTSSSSSASSSSSDSSTSRNKKRKRSKNDKKPKSVSPMGKRLPLGGRGGAGTSELVGYPIGGQGSVFGHGSGGHGQSGMDDYEQKVRKFLEMPRDEEDYEEKVRRFVAEASKYQKERKQLEDKSKKKKKKDEKKAKKESKKKRKSDEKKKSKKKDKGGDDDALDKDKLREALKIFENFPVLDELGSKLNECYAKMEKQQYVSGSVTEALSAIFGSGSGGIAGPSRGKPSDLLDLERAAAGDDNAKDGKWRMMFNKDKRPAKESAPAGGSFTAAAATKQHPFSNESDEDSAGAGPSFGMPKGQHADQRGSAANRFGTSGRYGDDRGGSDKAKPTTTSQMAPVKSGPVVLDKFGNFRLATADTPTPAGGSKPPEPAVAPPMRRSRSKSRHRTYGSSRSRSRSRSERRRSRSGSFRRRFSRSRSRSFSRSRSGSYSRSRSRSRSFERRRFDRRFYRGGRGGGGGGGGYGGGDRMGGPFGGNRFNNSRGHYRRGGFRDFRDNRYMGSRGGGGIVGGRDRPPFRPRYRGRYQRSYSRSMSKSPDRRQLSPGDDRPRHHNRRADSRDRGTTGQRGGDSRERSPVRRGSRGDSRDNQREDSRDREPRHRRSEERDTSKRSKDDMTALAGSGGSSGPRASSGVRTDEAANDSSPGSSRRRRSSSAGSQRSSGSNKIPHDIEGRWADDGANDDVPPKKAESQRHDDGGSGGAEGGAGSSAAASGSGATDDVSLEELEKMLTKARKERKEEMLERNKDLLKKTGF